MVGRALHLRGHRRLARCFSVSHQANTRAAAAYASRSFANVPFSSSRGLWEASAATDGGHVIRVTRRRAPSIPLSRRFFPAQPGACLRCSPCRAASLMKCSPTTSTHGMCSSLLLTSPCFLKRQPPCSSPSSQRTVKIKTKLPSAGRAECN